MPPLKEVAAPSRERNEEKAQDQASWTDWKLPEMLTSGDSASTNKDHIDQKANSK